MDSSKLFQNVSSRKMPSENKNIKRKGVPRKASDFSKEELLLTLQKKKECNAKALMIVEGLLEPNISESWFLEVLQQINQSHLQDVIEERAISKLCGYPLCCNILKTIPTQQYCISTKSNKVYDITERKLFCSNLCFRACRFIKDQMHTSPLWLRDIERSVTFTLMPHSDLSCGAGDEVEVGLGEVTKNDLKELKTDKIEESSCLKVGKCAVSDVCIEARNNVFTSENSSFVKMSDYSRNQTHKRDPPEESQDIILHGYSDVAENKRICVVNNTLEKITETPACFTVQNPINLDGGSELPYHNSSSENGQETKAKTEGHLSHVNMKEISDHPRSSLFTAFDGKEVKQSLHEGEYGTVNAVISMEDKVPNNSCENLETIGQDFNTERNLLTVTSCDNKATLNEKSSELQSDLVSLDMLKETNDVLNNRVRSVKYKKPLGGKNHMRKDRTSSKEVVPFIKKVEKSLQEWFTLETMSFLHGEEGLKIKFKERGEEIQKHLKQPPSTWNPQKQERFLSICQRLSIMEIQDNSFDFQLKKEEADDKRKPLPDYSLLKKESEIMDLKVKAFYKGTMELSDKKVTFSDDTKGNEAEELSHKPLQVPLLHSHSQRALRKKVVLEGLNRVLPDFFRLFGLQYSQMASGLRDLVNTFSLSPSNITFKPQEWTFLGLIILKLLSLREPLLKSKLECDQFNTFVTSMLISFKLDLGYLDRFIVWLTDIDHLLSEGQDDMVMTE